MALLSCSDSSSSTSALLKDLYSYNPIQRLRDGRIPIDPEDRMEYDRLSLSAKQEIDAHTDEIASLERKPEALKEECQVLLKYATALLSLSAPVHKLPNDVLAEVFGFIGRASWIVLGADKPRIPLDGISQVCARWRSIALSQKTLWTDIEINERASQKLVELILQRSGHLPLHTRIRSVNPALIDVTHRIQSLTLYPCIEDLPYIQSMRHSLGSLRTVALDLYYAVPFPEHARTGLTTLLPWHQLTTLRLYTYHFDADVSLKIVLQCTNLKTLIVTIASLLGDATPTQLDHLEKLIIVVTDPPSTTTSTTLSEFFQQLTLHSLKYLDVYLDDGATLQKAMDSFRNMLARSACPLSSLAVTINQLVSPSAAGSIERPSVYTKLVSLVPSLQVLKISETFGSYLASDFISQLTVRPNHTGPFLQSQPCLAPHLRCLEITSLASVDRPALLSMFESRSEQALAENLVSTVVPLKQDHLSFTDKVTSMSYSSIDFPGEPVEVVYC